MAKLVFFLSILLLVASPFSISGADLSTNSSWIVDTSGQRVKLTCVSWNGHMNPMMVEGLDKRPLSLIARHVLLMGFNCVRLTWATHMFTRHSNLTVVQSLNSLGLENATRGIEDYNPEILGLTIVEAQSSVIDQLGSYGLMVMLDNEVSMPMTCCRDDDGNGFFGDVNFQTDEWLDGLRMVAERYNHTPNVVAMSLRNELRGPSQNHQVWHRNIRRGADTVHKANPRVLILIPGLNRGTDFTPLKNQSLPRLNNFGNKLVYHTHRYASSTDMWLQQPTNIVCKRLIDDVRNKTEFLLHDGLNAAPIFINGFGIGGKNMSDSLFLSCYLAYLAEMDLDWAVSSLQGSYYIRNGIKDDEEIFGLLDSKWTGVRNPQFLDRLQFLQMQKIKGHKIMFHPLSGKCIRADRNRIHAGDCIGETQWRHDEEGDAVELVGSSSCLRADGDGLPVQLSTECEDDESSWGLTSSTNYHIANKGENGDNLCLEFDPHYSPMILTNKCLCTEEEDSHCLDDPQNQWFQFIIG